MHGKILMLTLGHLRLDVVLLEPRHSGSRTVEAYGTVQLHHLVEHALRICGLRVAHFDFVL